MTGSADDTGGGDVPAVLRSHHGVAELLAAALAREAAPTPGTEPGAAPDGGAVPDDGAAPGVGATAGGGAAPDAGGSVEPAAGAAVRRAWQRVLATVADPARRTPAAEVVRAELLRLVIEELARAGDLDNAAPAPPLGQQFLPAGDRWAGWWAGTVPVWPEHRPATRADVLRALRRMPVGLRAVLVVRDAAAVSADTAVAVLGAGPGAQAELLEQARLAYVTALDLTMTEHGPDDPPDGGPPVSTDRVSTDREAA